MVFVLVVYYRGLVRAAEVRSLLFRRGIHLQVIYVESICSTSLSHYITIASKLGHCVEELRKNVEF